MMVRSVYRGNLLFLNVSLDNANDFLLGTLDQLRGGHCDETRVKIVYSVKRREREAGSVSRVTNRATVNRAEAEGAEESGCPFESKICNPLFSQQARGTPGSSFCRHDTLH